MECGSPREKYEEKYKLEVYECINQNRNGADKKKEMERTLLRPRFVRKFSNIQVLPRGPSFPSLPSTTDMQYTDSYYFYQTMLLVTEFLREKT